MIKRESGDAPITSEYLDYDEVMHKFDIMMDWLAGLYVNILDLIQYMHDIRLSGLAHRMFMHQL